MKVHGEPRNLDYFAAVSMELEWPNLFLSELRQISTKFNNCWHTNSQDDKIMRGTLTVHLI